MKNRLRTAYRDLATRNTRLFLDVSKVLKTLAGEQLPIMALKGLALAQNVYGDIALRSMSDIDLLVKEGDLVRAGRILLTLGYRQDFPAWESLIKTQNHVPPFTNKNGTIIELHWNIVSPDTPIQVDLDGLWERACLMKVDHVEVRALAPEDLFLHLCIHACYHLQTGLGLIPLCDLAGLIKTSVPPIDWRIVIERAARWGGQKCVYLMSLLVRDLLGAAPPEKIMSEMKPDDYEPLYLDEALEQIFSDNPEIVSDIVHGPELRPTGQLLRRRIGKLSKIRKAQGSPGKVSALLKGAFPSKEYLAGVYPVSISSPRIYLYYFFRLGRLMVYFTAVLLRLSRRDPSVIKAVHQAVRVSAVSDWLFS